MLTTWQRPPTIASAEGLVSGPRRTLSLNFVMKYLPQDKVGPGNSSSIYSSPSSIQEQKVWLQVHQENQLEQ